VSSLPLSLKGMNCAPYTPPPTGIHSIYFVYSGKILEFGESEQLKDAASAPK
ncbi:hypothetical protein NDU88_008193, partial [Pleurodeles waltl]